jgi:hypothetical protein
MTTNPMRNRCCETLIILNIELALIEVAGTYASALLLTHDIIAWKEGGFLL